MIVSPCKGCLERYEACHDSCEKYKAWRVMKTGETEALKALAVKSRKIGEKRKSPEHNRTGVWKKTNPD